MSGMPHVSCPIDPEHEVTAGTFLTRPQQQTIAIVSRYLAHPVYGLATAAVPSGEIASLHHETRDDPVERAALVPKSPSL